MELKVTLYEVAEGIATITLNRPERLNAWTGRMHTEYRWCLEQAEQDAAVRAVIITGAGRGFCAGGDSKALEGHVARGGYDPGTPEDIPTPGYGVDDTFDAAFAYHCGLTKPVVAAINGPAAGVGLVLACWADVRFAAAGAKLTTAHGKLNLPAEYGLSWLLPKLIGLGHANDLLLTSRVVLAEEAATMGLVNAVLPADQLLKHTRTYVRQMITQCSPGSLASTRRQVYLDLHRSAADSVADSEERLRAMMREPDYREAIAAYTGKRTANWGAES